MKALIVHASPSESESSSRTIVSALVARYRSAHPDAVIRERDLVADPVPHFSGKAVAAAFTPPENRSDSQVEALRLSDRLCAELIEADAIVIGTPMWNLSVPSVLKAWVDHLVRVGVTFRYGENGPIGLLPAGKRLFIVESHGGNYASPGASELNHVGPYLRQIFGLMGVTDVETISISGTAYRRPEAIQESLERVSRLAV